MKYYGLRASMRKHRTAICRILALPYDLTKPMVAGGGPHYVIDPDTGTILDKLYEQ